MSLLILKRCWRMEGYLYKRICDFSNELYRFIYLFHHKMQMLFKYIILTSISTFLNIVNIVDLKISLIDKLALAEFSSAIPQIQMIFSTCFHQLIELVLICFQKFRNAGGEIHVAFIV